MRGLSLRLASAAAISAASLVAFAGAPGTASAACSGANIEGNGSTLQNLAQQKVWDPTFNKGCEAELKEQVSYNLNKKHEGSGGGMKTWGASGSGEHNFGPLFAFVGTDQPPSATKISEIEKFTGGGKVLTIPVIQAAVAVDIHLPTGCTSAEAGTSSKESKRFKKLALNEKTVEAIFSRKITKWSEIKDFGDKLLPEGCEGSSEITRVVREDGSGTTAIVKKFFFEINKGAVDGTKTWNELAEESPNTKWPEETEKLVKVEGGKGVAKKVTEISGAIGYSNMADARATKLYTPEGGGGLGTPTFWALVQNNPTSEKKYIDPATNGEENALGNSNCAGTKYVDISAEGKKAKFPPESTEDPWNEVTGELKAKAYPFCGFSYDLALTKYSTTESEGEAASAGEVETLTHFLGYVLGAGQANIENKDYLGLPDSGSIKKNPLLIAEAGVAKISF